MATLTFTVKGTLLNLESGFELLDYDTPRIINYLMNGTSYGVVTEDDNTTRAATPEEAARAFAKGILQGLLDQTVRWEKDVAASQAVATIATIAATPVEMTPEVAVEEVSVKA